MQYYSSKEELQVAYNLLQQTAYEAERKRQAEEIKALRLERELQAQRERLGRDLHDGFGSQITHIISRLDLLAHTGASDKSQLLRLSEFAREMNQTLRETIWLLDQESITAEAFGARLHGMLLKVWEDREAPVLQWKFLNTTQHQVLPPLLALHLVRITQEATNNALKYASATQTSITLAVQKTELRLTVADNGVGFDIHTAGQGFGLTNMRKRTEEAKGTFKVHTGPSGTSIEVLLPITS